MALKNLVKNLGKYFLLIVINFALISCGLGKFYQRHNEREKINNENIFKARFGELVIEKKDGVDRIIKFKGKVILNSDGAGFYEYLTIEAGYNLKDEDVYLIADPQGGNACGVEYRIIALKADGLYFVSKRFGTCYDKFEEIIKPDSVEIKMPLDGHDSKGAHRGKYLTYLYQAGILYEDGEALKKKSR
jgi:hypothetical protein